MTGAEAPSLASSYIRALLLPRRRGGPSSWPAFEAVREGVRTDTDHLRRYRELCGFGATTSLPPTYPHLTAFPMSMALMTGSGFPFRILGVVHIRNEITQLRPIHGAEPLDFRVWIDEPYRHAKGTAFDVGSEVRDSAGELVWSSISTYLRRGTRPPTADSRPATQPVTQSTETVATPRPTETWRLPADLGRRYAALSGDRNPIHLYPWTARMFGFKRQIAHGMWSAARCLATIEAARNAEAERSSERRLDFAVDFRAPVVLPSSVDFVTTPGEPDGTTDFTLTSAHSGLLHTHLVGRVGPVG